MLCTMLWIKTQFHDHLCFKKTQNPKKLNQQQLNKHTKQITGDKENKCKTQCATSLFRCRYFFHLQVYLDLASMVFVLLAGNGFFSFAFVFFCRQGRKGEGMLG